MRLALVLGSLSLGACSLGGPTQLAADPARPTRSSLQDQNGAASEGGVAVGASLPVSLACVGAADPDDAGVPQVVRARIDDDGDGRAQVWLARGPQFLSHRGVWVETAADPGILVAEVRVFGDVVLLDGDGIDLVVDGTGTFRDAEVFAQATFTGSLTCWDEQAIWGSPWAQIPSALPARFDWATGGCVDVDGAPALNELPIEFVRETSFGDCADLRGQPLNGDDHGGPDLSMSLRGARLDGAKLFHAQLHGSFEGADLRALGFGSSTLSGSFDAHTRLPVGDACAEIENPWGGVTIECRQ